MNKTAPNSRTSDLAKIHVAKKQLGMTDEDYRAMLWTQGRVHSSKDLDHTGRQRVLDHLKACGFKPAASTNVKRQARPTPAPEKIKLVRRIRAQLISLGNLPDSYGDGIAHQMFGLQFYEWGTSEQLQAITTALTYEQNKQGAHTQ
jgi:phage gp16-like protein